MPRVNATPRSVGHAASSRARAALDIAEQEEAEALDNWKVSARKALAALLAPAAVQSNNIALGFDITRTSVEWAQADAALTAARAAMPKRKGQ